MKRAIVIGAGLLGAATAWNLGQRGWSVTVIEAGPVAGAASGASFGWINANFFHDEAHHRLRVAGIAAHRRLDPRFVGLTDWSGCVWHEEAGEGQALFAARLEALGYPVRRLTRAAMARHLPAVTDPCEALLFPDEGAVDPAALTGALIEGAGAEVWTGLEVLGIETVQGRASGVATAAGKIAA
ncbi:MAG: FAD-binding oxidoreductase, partial [Rubellimicrobium sp.]|nr:FAD-binding oxidoreductase [Rubellimicrobium sp.]